ncbi:MAG: LPS export ABC transporter periplasmic protein LptC [Tannerellaceae bacterium]|nr:LPS export ABC transporter periplasmic protein LptC [Tannerellaceae bacterium]
MVNSRFPGKTNNKGIATVFAVVMLLLFSIACAGDKKDIVEVTYDPETTYTMKTTDVYELISDSGVVRARILAEEWYIYGKAEEPYWYFPEGFYAEKFDTLFQAEGFVKSDTAYHWTKKALWKLVGNVEIFNLNGDSIETSLMFWDQNEHLFYSDKFVRIVRQDGTIITGIGFETTEEMSNYIIYQAAGEFPMNESEPDSTARDSMGTENVRPTPRRRAVPPPHNPALNVPSRRGNLLQDSIQLQLLEQEMQRVEESIEGPLLPDTVIVREDLRRELQTTELPVEDLKEIEEIPEVVEE